MNSLSELNGYSQTLLSFTDDRIATVTFDRNVPLNQSTTTAVGQAHPVPQGIDIVEIVKPELMNVYYEIDVSSVTGASVSWPVTPTGCTVSNPAVGVYRMSGISSKEQWDLVKNPSIVIGATWDNDFTYYPAIHYDPSKTKAWNVFVLVGVIANLNSTASISAKLTGITTNNADLQVQASLDVSATHIKSLQASLQANATVSAIGDIAIRFNAIATMTTQNNFIFGPSPSLNSVSSLTSAPVKTTDTSSTLTSIAALTHPGTPRLRTSAVSVSSTATFAYAPRLLSIARAGGGVAANNTYYFIANETDNAIYIYNKSTLALFRTILNPNPYGNPSDVFGRGMVVTETHVVVAAPAEDVSPTILNVGKVYVFNISTGALVGTCSNPGTESTTTFGTALAFNGSQVAVGNVLEDYNGFSNAGSVHVFNTNGTLAYTIRPPVVQTNGRFGDQVEMYGDKLIIGGNIGYYVYSASSGSLLYQFTPTYMDSPYVKLNSSVIAVHSGYTTVDLYNVNTGAYLRTIDTIPLGSGIIPGEKQLEINEIYILRYNSIFTIGTGNIVWGGLNRPSGINIDWGAEALTNSEVVFTAGTTDVYDGGAVYIYKI